MSPITVEVPDDLAQRLEPVADELPRILELGLRQLTAEGAPQYAGASQLLEFFTELPTPEEILALRPSPELEERVRDLLAKNRAEGLTPAEQREWEHFQHLEHLLRIAKARARLKLASP